MIRIFLSLPIVVNYWYQMIFKTSRNLIVVNYSLFSFISICQQTILDPFFFMGICQHTILEILAKSTL